MFQVETQIEPEPKALIPYSGIDYLQINPDISENLAIWTRVNQSERLQGEPLVQGALTFQTPAGLHFE
jgi:hypothetical protein